MRVVGSYSPGVILTRFIVFIREIVFKNLSVFY